MNVYIYITLPQSGHKILLPTHKFLSWPFSYFCHPAVTSVFVYSWTLWKWNNYSIYSFMFINNSFFYSECYFTLWHTTNYLSTLVLIVTQWLPVLAIVNKAAMNIHIQVSVWTYAFLSLGKIYRCRIFEYCSYTYIEFNKELPNSFEKCL
jgi:hypothetical protein